MNRKNMLIATAVLVGLSVLATLTITTVWAPNPRSDPSGGFSFRVEIDGIAIASFSEVEGVNVSVDVFEYREGADQLKPQLVPGVAHFGPVILRKGITSPNKELWEWMETTLQGSVSRRYMSIILMDPSRTEIMRVNLADAWPSGWSLGRLDGLNKEPVLEELVIQYEDISVEIYGTD